MIDNINSSPNLLIAKQVVEAMGIQPADISTYITATSIYVQCTDLLPNTTQYAFFDGVRIDEYVQPATLRSNSEGRLEFTFQLPANKFPVGDKLLVVSNKRSVTGSDELNTGATVSASSVFHTIKSTELYGQRPLLSPTKSERLSVSDVARISSANSDPVAQSFDTHGKPDGVVLTSLDLFFTGKPLDTTSKIRVDIRELVGGMPNSRPVSSYSFVDIPWASVQVSTAGNVATKASFPAPILLKGDSDYCFTVSSKTSGFSLASAKLSDRELDADGLNTGNVIYDQPHTGSMFRSSNGITWTAMPYEDIKFTLRCAKFVSGQRKANFSLVPQDLLVHSSQMTFKKNGTAPTKLVVHFNRLHGLKPGVSKIRMSLQKPVLYTRNSLTGELTLSTTQVTPSLNGLTEVQFQGPTSSPVDWLCSDTSDDGTVAEFTIPSGVDESSIRLGQVLTLGYVSTIHFDELSLFGLAAASTSSNAILNTDAPAKEIGAWRFLNDGSKNKVSGVALLDTPSASGLAIDVPWNGTEYVYPRIGSTSASIAYRFELDYGAYFVIKTNAESHSVDSNFSIRNVSGGEVRASLQASDSDGFVVGDLTEFNLSGRNAIERPIVFRSAVNNANSQTIGISIESSSGYTSPIISATGNHLIARSNIINYLDSNDEELVSGGVELGSAVARYITRKNYLRTPAHSVKMFVEAYSNAESKFSVYIRTSSSIDAVDHASLQWTKLTCRTATNLSNTKGQFLDYVFSYDQDAAFDVYDLKIVSESLTKCDPPIIANYRAIIVE